MKREWSLIAVARTGGALFLCGGLLAGCDALSGGGEETVATVSTSRGELRIEERDVEAPDVFQLSDRGLWDGRPSLGGIWVAVPQRVEPDRVKITNQENGRTIVGGLFRKEVDTPGPAILVSADAAASLGMQAGTPASLELVVLRRETVEILPPPPVNVLEPEVETPSEDGALAIADVAEDADVAEIAAAAAAINGETIEATSLEPAASTAEAAPEAAETPATPIPASTPPESELDRPYIQVATVSAPAGANEMIQTLQREGLSGELRVGQSAGRTIFSVVIGPAKDKAERTEILRKVRRLGYSDAYPV